MSNEFRGGGGSSRVIGNPLPRPGGMTIKDAMAAGAGFDAENLPGRIDQAEMLRVLAQNVELKPSERAPREIQDAVIQGTRENPELRELAGGPEQWGPPPSQRDFHAEEMAERGANSRDPRATNYERGQVTFDGNDPRAPSRPRNVPPLPTSREQFRSDFNDQRNAPGVRPNYQQPPGALPPHIAEKLANIDRARANPDEFRRQQREAQEQHVRDDYDDDGRGDLEELGAGFDNNGPDEDQPRVSRSPRLPPRVNPNEVRRREVVTNAKNEPRRQPAISPEERAAAEAAREQTMARAVTPTKPRFVLKKIEPSGEFVRITPTSGGVFYGAAGADGIQVRRFNLTDAMQIQKAKENQNLTALIDAVGAAMAPGFDVRDLTMGDFLQVMYWHRFNSYQSIPFILNWTSKYGNKATYRLNETEIQYETMKISEEDLQPWLAEGFTMPRIRDFEMFSREELTPEERYIVERAQFFVGNPRDDGLPPDIQDKIDMMMEKGADSLDAVARISEFARLTNHGVIERVLLKDTLFNRETHLEKLIKQRELVERNIERLESYGTDQSRREALMVRLNAEELEDEIAKWEDEGAAAEVEDVTLNIPLLNFFPTI